MHTLSNHFDGEIVLITGGTSGIGEATAIQFASEGAKVAITGRRISKGEEVVRRIKEAGGDAIYINADHMKVDDCQQVISAVTDYYGRIDILFNNAGVVIQGNAEETTEEEWQNVIALNVTAVWRMSKLVLPHMRKNGKGVIINNASDWGIVGGKDAVAYCTSKGAVIQMTKAMALDHARENIRINAVCPGDTYVQRWVDKGYFNNYDPVDEDIAKKEYGKEIPIGRVGEVDEIARAVIFLASDDASYITGTTLVVDGGNTAM
ncbi:MAG: glucose 1-dehydrogenase [Anaerolineales bacterium]|nr:glucose 1-dehydrogenase [Anaerolineales bacterium]